MCKLHTRGEHQMHLHVRGSKICQSGAPYLWFWEMKWLHRICGRINSTFPLTTIMMIVVGVFGGFNVQSELRILGAPLAAPPEGGAVCTGRKRWEKNVSKSWRKKLKQKWEQKLQQEFGELCKQGKGIVLCLELGRSWRNTANPLAQIHHGLCLGYVRIYKISRSKKQLQTAECWNLQMLLVGIYKILVLWLPSGSAF